MPTGASASTSNWCTCFAPIFQNIAIQLLPALNFNSDEWHTDETVVKIQGRKYCLWLIWGSKTRFLPSFHIDHRRDSPQAFTILEVVKDSGSLRTIVSDRYFACQMPVKALHRVQYIRVEIFHADITNNLISMFIFFYNFVRLHSTLNNLTPAQCAGSNLSKKRKRELLLVA